MGPPFGHAACRGVFDLMPFGAGAAGMPPPWVYRGSDGALMISNGVTRATRIARLAAGTLITVEVIREVKVPLGHLPKIGDLIP